MVYDYKNELNLLGCSKDVSNAVIELLDVFRNQGHSGWSAHIVIDLFSRLEDGKNISDYDGMIEEALTELYDVYKKYNSKNILDIFCQVALHKPLTPLTGKQNEWIDVSDACGVRLFQNKRLSSVFAEDDNGKNAYDIDAIYFKDKNGVTFSYPKGAPNIKFPYVQKIICIEEDSKEAANYDVW